MGWAGGQEKSGRRRSVFFLTPFIELIRSHEGERGRILLKKIESRVGSNLSCLDATERYFLYFWWQAQHGHRPRMSSPSAPLPQALAHTKLRTTRRIPIARKD